MSQRRRTIPLSFNIEFNGSTRMVVHHNYELGCCLLWGDLGVKAFCAGDYLNPGSTAHPSRTQTFSLSTPTSLLNLEVSSLLSLTIQCSEMNSYWCFRSLYLIRLYVRFSKRLASIEAICFLR
jgi:hypothetical protein